MRKLVPNSLDKLIFYLRMCLSIFIIINFAYLYSWMDGVGITKHVTVSVQNGKVFINNAEVVITDIVASNWVIHVIDAVLSPPS